jgi:hypothetical protein
MIPFMLRPMAWSVLSLLLPVAGVRAEETLQAPALRERIQVERTQFEVIVWPPKDDVAACRSMTNDDFELRLAHRPFVDFKLDPVGTPPEAMAQGLSEPTPSRLVALMFNWWGMSKQGGFDEFSPQFRAFTQARAYIEQHPSDRFVIFGIADEADFLSTTFQSGPDALAALDRYQVDVNASGFLFHSAHLDNRDWHDGVIESVRRLGAMEPLETKDLFVLTADVYDVYFRDLFHGDLSKVTTQNKVRVHSLDLAWDLRVLPYGVFAFSEAGGGVVFGNGNTLTTAIETLDRLRPCTFRITLKVPESKRALPLSVTMRNPRFRVTAPEAVGGRIDVAAAEQAELKNDYEGPATEVGVRITPKLVRLSGGELSADYALTLLVEKTGDFDPEGVDTLLVYGTVWNPIQPKKAMYADYSAFRITAEGLRKIAESGSEIFRFPDTVTIPNRETDVSVMVSVHGPRESLSRVSASRRIEVPLPE